MEPFLSLLQYLYTIESINFQQWWFLYVYFIVFKSRKEIVAFWGGGTAERLPGRFVQLEIRQSMYMFQTIIVSANRIISVSASIKLWIAHSWKIVKGREGEVESQTWYARKNILIWRKKEIIGGENKFKESDINIILQLQAIIKEWIRTSNVCRIKNNCIIPYKSIALFVSFIHAFYVITLSWEEKTVDNSSILFFLKCHPTFSSSVRDCLTSEL